MAKDPSDKLRRLKQADEVWEGTARLARTWITPKNKAPYRPFLVAFVDEKGKMLTSKLFDTPPSTDDIWGVLTQAMRGPMWGAGWPRRPKVVYFDQAEHVKGLASRLGAIDVRCEIRQNLPTLAEAMASMERWLNKGRELIPGLASISGITLPLLGHLYTAAAEFFEATPWRVLNDHHPIEIRYPLDAPARYAVVMGSGGEVYGLSVQDTAADLLKMLGNTSDRDLTNEICWLALFYEEAMSMAFDDLDAVARYGWLIPGKRAYPVFGRTQPKGQIGLPTRQDLIWLSGALPAISMYYDRHLQVRRGVVRPAELTLAVSILGSTDQVYLRLPAFGPKVV